MSIQDEIRNAMLNGQPGGQGLPTNITPATGGILAPAIIKASDAYVSLDVPVWAAQRWLVTAVAMRYTSPQAGGAWVGPPLTATYPPDSQVSASPGLNASSRIQLRVEYGVGNTKEVARVDYPWAGTTFALHAASLRIYLDDTFFDKAGDIVPTLGVFVTPVSGDAVYPSAEFTYPPVATGAGAGAFTEFVIPRRARGYNVYFTSAADMITATGGQMRLEQRTGLNGGSLNRVDWAAQVSTAPGSFIDPGNANSWFPIAPGAEVVRVVNQNAAGGFNIGVRFRIEL